MEGLIDISGISKVRLLEALWERQTPSMWAMPCTFNEAAARQAVRGYIDYFQQRAIKTDLSKDDVSPRLYDRDAGIGAFAEVVAKMRIQ